MKPLPPFVVYGTHAIENNEILDYKNDLTKLLDKIANNDIDLDLLGDFEHMNDYLAKL